MTDKETFLLVSLNENKAKKLAEVISNKTSRKILDLLSKGEKTETEISKELNVPISTVHYNLKHLVDAKLVKDDSYHYSKKGREVSHYTLANQYVIIAPQSAKEGIMEKLKTILPAATITVALGTVAQLIYKGWFEGLVAGAQKTFEVTPKSAEMVAMAEHATLASPSVEQTTRQFLISDVNVFLWFVAGASIFLASYLFVNYVRKKMKK